MTGTAGVSSKSPRNNQIEVIGIGENFYAGTRMGLRCGQGQ